MDENHNIEQEKWELLAKSIYDREQQATSEEQTSTVDELLIDPKEKEQVLDLTKKLDLFFQLKKYPTENAWEKVQDQIHHRSISHTFKVRNLIAHPILRIAAAVFFAVLLSVAGYDIVSNWGLSTQLVELSVAKQAVKTVILPDGTVVSLNSNTHLKYPKQFANNTREVTLEGEGFFEVRPNKEKPFIIHAGNAQVKVIGTSFNVNAYPHEKFIEVVVKTGKVRVTKAEFAKHPDELILNPGDKGTLENTGNILLKTTNENPNFLAWKTHDLIFRSTSLVEVISNLENVYKVKILLDDPKLNTLLLTAHFNNYSLDFILKVIETTFKLETQKIDGQYILKAQP